MGKVIEKYKEFYEVFKNMPTIHLQDLSKRKVRVDNGIYKQMQEDVKNTKPREYIPVALFEKPEKLNINPEK